MRFPRPARAGFVLVAVLGTMATFVPSASALGGGTMDFIGTTAFSTGSLGAPVLTGTPSPTVKSPTNKKTPALGFGGNTASAFFASSAGACVGALVVGPNKPKPGGVHGTQCSIGARFIVTGFCGLSQGTGTGSAVIGGKWIWFNLAWVGNVLTGNWWQTGPTKPPQSQRGDIMGLIVEVPPNPLFGVGSCLNKTARSFEIIGSFTLVNPKILPKP